VIRPAPPFVYRTTAPPARRLARLLHEAAAEPPADASWHPLAGI
jgi:hypothetical protein